MDLPSISPVIAKLLEQGVLVVLLLYAVYILYKKVMEVQEARVKDSLEREKSVTIALEEVGSAMKTIMIRLDDKHGK